MAIMGGRDHVDLFAARDSGQQCVRVAIPAAGAPAVGIGAYTEELTLGTGTGPSGSALAGGGSPSLPGSRVVEVPNGIASRRADAPTPAYRAGRARGTPLAKMLTTALWSAFAVCPHAVHWNTAWVLRFSLSTCWHTAQVCDV